MVLLPIPPALIVSFVAPVSSQQTEFLARAVPSEVSLVSRVPLSARNALVERLLPLDRLSAAPVTLVRLQLLVVLALLALATWSPSLKVNASADPVALDSKLPVATLPAPPALLASSLLMEAPARAVPLVQSPVSKARILVSSVLAELLLPLEVPFATLVPLEHHRLLVALAFLVPQTLSPLVEVNALVSAAMTVLSLLVPVLAHLAHLDSSPLEVICVRAVTPTSSLLTQEPLSARSVLLELNPTSTLKTVFLVTLVRPLLLVVSVLPADLIESPSLRDQQLA